MTRACAARPRHAAHARDRRYSEAAAMSTDEARPGCTPVPMSRSSSPGAPTRARTR
jgi:hypothetical protein